MAFESREDYMARIDPKTLSNPGSHVVSDADGLLGVSRESMRAVRIEVNGEVRGSVMLCSELSDATLARNLSWNDRLNLGYGVLVDMTAASEIVVDMAGGIVQATI